MTLESYHLTTPHALTAPIVFGSPHSGRFYTESFLENSQLNQTEIRSSEDAFVNDLFSCVTEYGAPLLSATAPRAYLDLNRQVDELDPALIKGVKPNKNNPRITSGLGVIPRIVAEGKPIQTGKMTIDEAQARIDQYYHPYHNRLHSLLAETYRKFGRVLLIDCHSMPHAATTNMVVKGGGRPDIVLGDRFGASCGKAIVDKIETAFVEQGFSVSRNVPFAGAYIVQNYGRPSKNQHALQIEIDRSLYMDEATIQKSAGFWNTRDRITRVIQQIIQAGALDDVMAAE